MHDYESTNNNNTTATTTQAGYKGQMTPTNQIRGSHDVPDVGKVDIERTQGAMLGGAGKNAKPNDSSVTTMTATNPQGNRVTYSTNRNL